MADPPLPRDQFPLAERVHYLNHAGIAPLPLAVVEAVAAGAQRMAEQGSLAADEATEDLEAVRAKAALVLGVSAVDVAFVKNTTEGLGFVANGLEWEPGDRVVVPDLEFPSTLYPWLALEEQGVVVDRVAPVGPALALPLEAFADALAAGPAKVVACSWVQFGRGWRTDLAALATLCHDHGALLCADVIQGLGAIPAELAAWGVDFAMADAHKWLLGPEGIGVLYVAERCRDLLRPLEPGWASVAHRMEWDNLELVYDDSARRFEGGSHNHLGVAGMGAALDLLLDAGIDAVWSHVDGLCERLVASLSEVGATVASDRGEGRSGIVTCTLEGVDPDIANDALAAQGIVASPRSGGLRFSPHGWNDDTDIDAAVAAVANLTR